MSDKILFFRRDVLTGNLMFSIGFQPDEIEYAELTQETFIEMCHELGFSVTNIKVAVKEIDET